MRRIVGFVVVAALAAGISGAPTAGASPRPAATRSTKSFCRAMNNFVKYFEGSPDPKAFAKERGKKVLRALAARSPKPVDDHAATIAESFTYLSKHGRGSLSQRRDDDLGDALFQVGIFGASHCKQKRVKAYGSFLAERRLAKIQAEQDAADPTTSTTRSR